MIKLKKILFYFLFLFFSNIALCEDGVWNVITKNDVISYLSTTNSNNSKFTLACPNDHYFINLYVNSQTSLLTEGYFEKDFKIILVDDSHLLFSGTSIIRTQSMNWFIKGIYYNVRDSFDGNSSIQGYKTLFQQMLNAKESLTVSAQDADGNQHTVSFSVKGLPEAIMDLAERCGPEFQEFSGIKPNPKIEP